MPCEQALSAAVWNHIASRKTIAGRSSKPKDLERTHPALNKGRILETGTGTHKRKRNAAVAAKNVYGSFVRGFRERNLVEIDRLVELGSAFRGGETFGDGVWQVVGSLRLK